MTNARYTNAQRLKALEVFDRTQSATKTVRELGYPGRWTLHRWIRERDEPPAACGEAGVKKNGKTRKGVTRYRCTHCGASHCQTRPHITRKAQPDKFAQWIIGKLSISEVTSQSRMTWSRQNDWCWRVEPRIPVTGEVYDEIQVDKLKTWHSGSKYERKVWRCNDKYKNTVKCTTPVVESQQIEAAFVEALSRRITGHAGAHRALEVLEATTFNTAAQTAIDPDEYDQKYADLETRYNLASTKHADLDAQIADRQARLEQARTICDFLDSNPPLEYSDDAWSLLVDHVNVASDGTMTISFKDQVAA